MQLPRIFKSGQMHLTRLPEASVLRPRTRLWQLNRSFPDSRAGQTYSRAMGKPKASKQEKAKQKPALNQKNEPPKILDLPDGGIDIDGSMLEGGGQIIRNAMACSALRGIPIRIQKIRGNRSKPGLRAQHLAGIQLVRDICQGKLEGDFLGSQCISFVPGEISDATYYEADAQTAGAVTLLAQVSIPVLLFAKHKEASTKLILRGGTNTAFAPTIDYLEHVFAKNLSCMYAIELGVKIKRRGFFPKGGGGVEITVPRLEYNHASGLATIGFGIDIRRPRRTLLTIHVFTAGQFHDDAAKMSWEASKILKKSHLRGMRIEEIHDHAECISPKMQSEGKDSASNKTLSITSGKGMLITAKTDIGVMFGSSYTCEKGTRDEDTIQKVADELIKTLEHGAGVDEWMQDQLIIFMGLTGSRSRLETGPITLHTKTAIAIVETLTEAKFKIEGTQSCIIRCNYPDNYMSPPKIDPRCPWGPKF